MVAKPPDKTMKVEYEFIDTAAGNKPHGGASKTRLPDKRAPKGRVFLQSGTRNCL